MTDAVPTRTARTTSAHRFGHEGRGVLRAAPTDRPISSTMTMARVKHNRPMANSPHAPALWTRFSTHQESKAHSHVPPRFRSTEF